MARFGSARLCFGLRDAKQMDFCGSPSVPAMSSRAMQPVVCLFTRRSEPLLTTPRFPILSLDERRLTPALGYIFDVMWLLPGESIARSCGCLHVQMDYRDMRSSG